ncbi:stage II sporulation protein D [Fontibacillus solani]|uniref:Stage II sporulation protein D n=1 Tax=Fontibacillus solani TaxID=1572857 RepID=A0A7W3ST17_9BACL|nr:stage II sporulation protein D [Fontibacillus solani]MBA9085740.1 stage II sporulation protein D [Fontibacillus solani]
MEEMKNERNIDDKKTNVITVKLTAEKHKGVREAQHEWAGPAASQPMQPPAAHSAAGPVPARLAPAPRARSRTSFRHGGRRFGALSALAVLLPALLAGRAPAPAAQVPDAAAAAQANSAAPQQGAAGGAGRLAPAEASPEMQVRVYLTRTRTVETLPLEQYVTGVLAAEMPADFDLDALKAQAIAARTYIISRLQSKNTSGVPNGKADVVDSVDHQAYLSQAELKKWAQQGKEAQLEKLQKAVDDTKGIYMTYKGKPITAAFFSASGGYTENSEDYWNLKVPYLRSVSSPWDAKMNPKNQVTVTLSLEEVFEKLGQQIPAEPAINNKEAPHKMFQMISTTPGGRVNEIRIGDKVYTGREVREKLGLRSSQFTIKASNSEVKITTYGSGHGVGMSQWGANGMAKEGYTTTQILQHYYTGISFQQAGQ